MLKKNFLRKKKGGKLDDRYDGPFKIAKQLPNGVYLIESIEDPSKVFRVTGAHLKPFNFPNEQAHDATESKPLPQIPPPNEDNSDICPDFPLDDSIPPLSPPMPPPYQKDVSAVA